MQEPTPITRETSETITTKETKCLVWLSVDSDGHPVVHGRNVPVVRLHKDCLATDESLLALPGIKAIIDDRAHLRNQIAQLATFIMENVDGEPSESEGACDTAIRIIRGLLGRTYKVEIDASEVDEVADALELLKLERDEARDRLEEAREKCRELSLGYVDLTYGARAIAEERNRQINERHYTAEHDDQHKDGELALAACCFASPRRLYTAEVHGDWFEFDFPWPWPSGAYAGRGKEIDNDQLDIKSRLVGLAKAGALIAAEIDRLTRLEIEQASPSPRAEGNGG